MHRNKVIKKKKVFSSNSLDKKVSNSLKPFKLENINEFKTDVSLPINSQRLFPTNSTNTTNTKLVSEQYRNIFNRYQVFLENRCNRKLVLINHYLLRM